ncbi:MAG: hypothetical protein KKG59_05035, partial [Nanoarchaeota archaeon]|nr:hypothetical protein [Nanoarchaeota archaeon]
MNIRALSLTVIALFCIAYGLVYSRIEILVFGMSLVLYMLLTYITLRIKCANMRFIVSKQLDRQSIEKKGIKISINAKTNSKVYFDVIDKAPKNIVGGSNIVRDCKDNADFTYSLMFKNYGVFQTGPTIAKMHDLQGLFYFEKKIYNSSYVIVY